MKKDRESRNFKRKNIFRKNRPKLSDYLQDTDDEVEDLLSYKEESKKGLKQSATESSKCLTIRGSEARAQP